MATKTLRFIDRGRQADKHIGPYYGWRLARVLSGSEPSRKVQEWGWFFVSVAFLALMVFGFVWAI